MAKKTHEPFFWAIFSAGGVMTALFVPVQLFLFALAFPLGWLEPPSHESLLTLLRNPLTQLYLLVLCTLGLFHWAHRFRHTLYDALKVKHLGHAISFLCYGAALVGSGVAAYLLWNIA